MKLNLNKVIEIIKEGDEYFIVFKKDHNRGLNDAKIKSKIEEGYKVTFNGKEVNSCRQIMILYWEQIDDDLFADGIEE